MQTPGVLVIHNRYQQSGGEDAVVRAEIDLLRSRGHRVVTYIRDNAEIANYSAVRKASLFVSTTWNGETYNQIRELIRTERPHIAHCHNFLPLVSPAAYYACQSAGIPVVQTLHNYRLFCPAGTLFSDGEICQRCRRSLLAGVRRRCYRGSCLQTAAVSLMLTTHRMQATWARCVHAYLTPSRFCRDYFVAAGLPGARVHLQPNFLAHDPGQRSGRGEFALFLGRLSAEKGVLELVEAWQHLPEIPLLIAGEGPLHHQVQAAAHGGGTKIQMLGNVSPQEVLARINGARFLVFPSRWYEPFGMALLEAAACGVPAIASRIGAIPELVSHRRTGLLFDPDDFSQLVQQVRWAWQHPEEMEEYGRAARQMYLRHFTAARNYELLMQIYQQLLRN